VSWVFVGSALSELGGKRHGTGFAIAALSILLLGVTQQRVPDHCLQSRCCIIKFRRVPSHCLTVMIDFYVAATKVTIPSGMSTWVAGRNARGQQITSALPSKEDLSEPCHSRRYGPEAGYSDDRQGPSVR
jgi:hypothetical protein